MHTGYAIARSGVTPVVGGVLAAAAGAAAAAGLGRSDSILWLAAIALVTAAQWTVLTRASTQPVPQVGIMIVMINSVGVLGWLYYPDIAGRAAVSAVLPETAIVYRLAASIFVAASLSLFCGALATSRLGGRRHLDLKEIARQASSASFALSPRILTVLALLPLVLLVLAYQPEQLVSRARYADAIGPGFAILGSSALMPAGIIIAALLYVRDRTPTSRLILAGYLVAVFATGSRSLALIPFALFLVWLLVRSAGAGARALLVRVLATGVFGALCLQLPLTMRGNTVRAGIVPYLGVLSDRPELLLQLDLPKISGNVLFSFPLAAVSAQRPDFPMSWLVTSVNPLPGGLTDWGEVSRALRLNPYTPTSGLGELANYGPLWLIGVCLFLGAALTLLQQWNLSLPTTRATISTVVGFGASALIALDLLQYNLRSGARFFWYYLALSLLLHLLSRRRPSLHSRAVRDRPGGRAPTPASRVPDVCEVDLRAAPDQLRTAGRRDD